MSDEKKRRARLEKLREKKKEQLRPSIEARVRIQKQTFEIQQELASNDFTISESRLSFCVSFWFWFWFGLLRLSVELFFRNSLPIYNQFITMKSWKKDLREVCSVFVFDAMVKLGLTSRVEMANRLLWVSTLYQSPQEYRK